MRFLRRRRDEIESVWMSDRYSAVQKSHALSVLGNAVVIVRHPYERDPQSGSGNCWCGRHEKSTLHAVVLEPVDA